ncbi:MAG: hypothetical protein IPJ65_15940 [Archangiaceae bacterium]|nr:hypothetical protein [Archangiaceae bacterium]
MKGQRVFELPFEGRAELDFEVNAARIEVLPVEPGGTPRIESRRPGAPLEIRSVGGKVSVRLAGNWGVDVDLGAGVLEGAVSTLLRGGYGGEFTVYLPQSVRARLAANMGQARVRGLAGCDLELTTNAGQIEVDDCRGRFVLKAKAGQIIGRRLGGTFAVESGAGEVVLDIVALDEGVHTVHSTMGAVKIDLRPGLEVRIESRTVMGSTRTRYPSKSDAKTVLKLEAELGAVKVREGDGAPDPRRGDWPDWRKVWSDAAETPDPSPAYAGQTGAVAHPTELRTILELVQHKKLSAEEAERLIAAL